MKKRISCFKKEKKKLLVSWEKEFEFWKEYAQIYRNLEKARPYYNLLKVIGEFLDPKEGEIWLDAGCGPAKVSYLIWEKSERNVEKIVGVDIVLQPAYETLSQMKESIPLKLEYANLGERLSFPDNFFDGIVANLILTYIIEFEGKRGKDAFIGVMEEMFRILKPGGRLIWSTPKENVNFIWVFLASIPDMLNIYEYIVNKDVTRIIQGTKILKHALKIQKKGKEKIYTFLPKEEIEGILLKIGFVNPICKKTFAGQVWVYRVEKPY